MHRCKKCQKLVDKAYEFYEEVFVPEWRNGPVCAACVPGWEFEAGMWKKMK